MLNKLIIFFLLFKISYGFYLGTNSDSWQTDFTNNLEEFLETPESNISALCKLHLTQYIQDLRGGKQWAAKMFDAGAKLVPQGVLAGNLVDLGSFDECLNIEHHINGSSIHGKYCLGKISVDTKLQQIEELSETTPETVVVLVPKAKLLPTNDKFDVQMAKCFPDSCSFADMETVYAYYGFKMVFDDDLCQTKADQPKLDMGGVITISIFGIILLLVIASTAYDVSLHYLIKKPHHPLLVAFSAFRNGSSLISITEEPNNISCLHGIRAITMMWVVLAHEYTIRFNFPMKNAFYNFEWISNEANMYMFSSGVAIDTFLLLTGLLISYRFMNDISKRAKFNIFIHYINRYLRLTPALLMIILFHIGLLNLMGSGPLWLTGVQKKLVESCKLHGWKNLFYIQNIYSNRQFSCVAQTWYLCVDMQLFIFSPIVFFLLQKSVRMALSVVSSLAVVSTIICFLVGWFFELNPYWYLVDTNLRKYSDYLWYYYFPMHTRASPWIIGIIVGYFVFKSKQKRVQLESRIAKFLVWLISMAVLCTCLFVGYQTAFGKYNRLTSSFHLSLVRPAWSLAIAYVIFACVSGIGGPVNWFLSLPVFQVMSKLTYCMYLIHHTVINVVTARMKTVPVFDNSEVAYKYWSDLAITLAISVVLHLAIECPVLKIDKYLFGGKQKKQT